MLQWRRQYHRHFIRIETDGDDDLVHLAMIALAGIATPRTSVALHQQRRIVGATLRDQFELDCKLHGDRHRIALGFFRATVSAAAFAAFRHHQFWAQGMIV